jgi:hypothetical protein
MGNQSYFKSYHPMYTLEVFDPTTHNSAGGDDATTQTTVSQVQGNIILFNFCYGTKKN